MLDHRKAGRAHRRIFWHVWAQIHKLGPQEKHTRTKLAAVAECSEDYAGACVTELRAWELLMVNYEGESGRWKSLLVGRNYFVGLAFSYDRLTPRETWTPEKTSGSHYKATPLGKAQSRIGLYSSTASARLPSFKTQRNASILADLGFHRPQAPPSSPDPPF